MSLRYRLFGIPKTLDEFIEKIRNRGMNEIDVTAGAYDSDAGIGHLPSFHCCVGLKAGRIHIFHKEFTHRRQGYLFDTVIGKAEIQKEGLGEAIEIAKKLTDMGFRVTINGHSIVECQTEISRFGESIRQRRQEYNLFT